MNEPEYTIGWDVGAMDTTVCAVFDSATNELKMKVEGNSVDEVLKKLSELGIT